MNRNLRERLFLVAVVFSTALLTLTACGSSHAKFCEIAGTSTQGRTQAEIDEYYEQMEAAAPDEIKDDVATLRQGWQRVSFPLGQAVGGEITNMSRPPEVSEAARNVFEFVGQVCGTEGGVYLIFPEIGF